MQPSVPPGPPRADRLRRRADFVAASRGRRWNSEMFGLQMRERAELAGPARFGITVTKKTAPLAVERNRIRRRLREALRLGAALAATPQRDYVVVGRRPLLDVAFADLREQLGMAIAKIGTERPRRRATDVTHSQTP